MLLTVRLPNQPSRSLQRITKYISSLGLDVGPWRKTPDAPDLHTFLTPRSDEHIGALGRSSEEDVSTAVNCLEYVHMFVVTDVCANTERPPSAASCSPRTRRLRYVCTTPSIQSTSVLAPRRLLERPRANHTLGLGIRRVRPQG